MSPITQTRSTLWGARNGCLFGLSRPPLSVGSVPLASSLSAAHQVPSQVCIAFQPAHPTVGPSGGLNTIHSSIGTGGLTSYCYTALILTLILDRLKLRLRPRLTLTPALATTPHPAPLLFLLHTRLHFLPTSFHLPNPSVACTVGIRIGICIDSGRGRSCSCSRGPWQASGFTGFTRLYITTTSLPVHRPRALFPFRFPRCLAIMPGHSAMTVPPCSL